MNHSSFSKNPKNSHNNQSQRIGASKERKTTRSTGNAVNVERNQILSGMGHKHTSHVTKTGDDSQS